MQSNIKINFEADQVDTQQIASPPLTNLLQTASTETLALATGKIIVQSVDVYFAYIEVFDYNFTRTTLVDVSVTKPSYFMETDRKKNTCYLFYRPKGKYKKRISSGFNQIILITFKADWLIYKCRRLPELEPFTSLFFHAKDKPINLPSIGIAESIGKSLQKMDTLISDTSLLDNDGYAFANSCINKYYNKLKGKHATSQFHHRLAKEISLFIDINFASEHAECIPKLAKKFMVSERNLTRLANIAFGMPLHEQVIKLRMDYAKTLLNTTDQPIKKIALLCGYKDAHYFSKAFKKYHGESPKAAIPLGLRETLNLSIKN